MRPISELFSVYIVVIMFGLGVYFVFLQSKYLKNVDKLIPEARFTRIVGILYMIISVVGGVIAVWR